MELQQLLVQLLYWLIPILITYYLITAKLNAILKEMKESMLTITSLLNKMRQ